MKKVKEVLLYFSEGKSDKVYEVSLCGSDRDLFIVNFRYGRRGSNLREGTKTVFPVAYDEAIKIYDKLIADKRKKGYRDASVSTETNNTQEKEKLQDIKKDTVLKYLKSATLGTYTRNWKVSRIIWKAADLNIKEATTYLPHFLGSDDEFEQYAAIYTLCKFEDISNLDKILCVFRDTGYKNKVGRIAAAYILRLGEQNDKSIVLGDAFNALSNELQLNLKEKGSSLINAISLYTLNDKEIDASALYYIYLYTLEDETLKSQLYQFIEKVPLKVNTFKSIRYIYRASHLLRDYAFSALIAKRIAISKPGYTTDYLYVNNQWITSYEEKQKSNPSVAFSKKTKNYFNKSTYALIYELSKQDEDEYIKYATQILTVLDDKIDKVKEDVQVYYDYDWNSRQYNTEKRFFPKYQNYLALMYILYGGSLRFRSQNGNWFYTEAVDLKSSPREEALQEVWNRKPDEVLYILANAKSEEAVQFALRIIQDNKHFLDQITNDILSKLISHYHPEVLDIIIDIVKQKYATTQPELYIIVALLKANTENTNKLALDWLKQYEGNYLSNPEVVTQLLLVENKETVLYLKEVYKDTVAYNAILSLLNLNAFFEEPPRYSEVYLLDVNDLIGNTHFGKLLSLVSQEDIHKLASSNSVTNKLFAANLAKHNTIPAYQLFKDTVDEYIESGSTELRKIGIELLLHFPDQFLLENHQKISAFIFSEYQEVRRAIQPTVERLISLDDNFKKNLFKKLLSIVINDEFHEGVHENCYELLSGNYQKYLATIPEEDIFDLILSKYEYAQKIGLPLFNQKIDLNKLSVETIVSLSHCDILEIRDKVRLYFKANSDRINYELEAALRIFNSDWKDIIHWACDYFKGHITSNNWTVDMLLYTCDHVNPEVQQFGRTMIATHFTEDKGLPLLLKLQEHPTKTMQFFVTNYLDNYARDNAAVILKLESYFKTSLFNINTNRVTKTRIYTFLKQESIKNREVAEMTVRLIHAVLGTNIITDQSHNIDMLLTIAEIHPEIEVPLLIKES